MGAFRQDCSIPGLICFCFVLFLIKNAGFHDTQAQKIYQCIACQKYLVGTEKDVYARRFCMDFPASRNFTV